MDQPKHTPGPWIAQRSAPDRKSVDPWRILSMHPSVGCAGCHVCDIDGEGDALLIADAPKMLDLLRELHDFGEPTQHFRYRERAAVMFEMAGELLKKHGG